VSRINDKRAIEMNSITGRVLTHFLVKNFKSIGEDGVLLELKPVTLLFGPQGSGKSAILEALWRVCEIISKQEEISHISYIEPTCSYEDLVHKHEIHRKLELGIYTQINQNIYGWKISYWVDRETGNDMAEQYVTLVEEEDPEKFKEKIILGIRRKRVNEVGFRDVIVTSDKGIRKEFDELTSGYSVTGLKDHVFKISALPGHERQLTADILQREEESQKIIRTIYTKLKGNHVEKFALLSPLRGDIPSETDVSMRMRYDNELKPLDPRGRNLIPFLSCIREYPGYSKYWSYIVRWSEFLGLADLRAGYTGIANKLTSEFKDSKMDTVIKLSHGSYGARQALSICAQLFSPTQNLIMIEEPEISLHPETVAELPLMFYEALKLGKQIIATTHSPILPLAIPRLVTKAKEEGLCTDPNELIAVYEVYKDRRGTSVKKLRLNERGYIIGYIESFLRVERQLLEEWEKGLPE